MTKRNTKNQKPKTSGVVFPPPFIYLGSIIAGIILNTLWTSRIFDAAYLRFIFGIIAILLAVSIFVNSFKTLARAKTPIQPYKPTLKIVKTGPYEYSRNPVYLSFSLFQIGIAFLLNNLWVLIALLPAIMAIHHG